MKKYNVILFDLDGTITNPGTGITNSVAFALNRFGITINDRAKLYKFIGPPLIDSFKEYYGFDNQKARTAVEYYREYYSKKGIFENELYNGIKQLLTDLKSLGKTVGLATSKPDLFAVQILKYFEIDSLFDFVSAATIDETRTKKEDIISFALETNNLSCKQNIVMVGDRRYDISGAEKNGIDSIGVLFGFGSRHELEAAGATHVAASVEELAAILL